MKRLRLYLSLAATLCLAAGAHASDVDTFHRQLIQGDVQAALQTAHALPAGALPAQDAAALACMAQRFAAPPAPASGKGAAVLDAYRAYWHAVLLGHVARADADARLLDRLDAVVPADGGNRASLDDTTERVRRFLESQGLHALAGVTRPNYELMVWKRETARTYPVALPERSVTVRVVFLDGFLSRGWLSYASCDRFGASGWTSHGVLYALADRYDTGSEDFRVSYLGHEGQHFADNDDFPALEQSELEYRAKLAEIVLSADPERMLARFARTAHAGRAVPHLHAEYWLVRRIRERLGDDASAAGIRALARRLLIESSAAARTAGAGTVTRLLPN